MVMNPDSIEDRNSMAKLLSTSAAPLQTASERERERERV